MQRADLMTRFSTYLFDLDGTLIDHFAAIRRAHTYTLGKLGLAPPTAEQVRDAVGGGLERAIAMLAGPERVAAALEIYWPYWHATMLDDVVLLPGVRELLTRLRAGGAKLAVLTNKHGPSSRLICDHLGLTPLLDGNFGAGDTPWLKPRIEFTQYALAQLGVTVAGTVLIGDSPFDVETAQRAGFPGWCVTTGTHNAAELTEAKADRVFASMPELQMALGL